MLSIFCFFFIEEISELVKLENNVDEIDACDQKKNLEVIKSPEDCTGTNDEEDIKYGSFFSNFFVKK